MARWFARLSWRRGALFGLSAATLAPAAGAQTEAIRIEYSAAPDCPGANEFVRSVFSRTSRAHLVEEGAASRTFVIVLERTESGFVGSLALREGDQTTMARKVADSKCAAVAEALALATSLAIDPNATLTPGPSPEKDTTKTEPKVPPEGTPPPSRDPSDGQGDRRARGEHAWDWNAELGPTVAVGIGPRLAIGGAAAVAWGTKTPLAPVSSLGVELAFLNTLPKAIATASSEFRFYFARPELCSINVVLTSGFAAAPCLGVELGAVTGSGSDIAEPSTRTRFWAALDARLRLRADLSARWFIDANADLVAPLVRYRFVFRDPDTTVHEVPPLGAAFGMSVGAWFL